MPSREPANRERRDRDILTRCPSTSNAVVLENRGCRTHYSVLVLDAPEIAAAVAARPVRHGQAVARHRSAAAPAVLRLRNPARRDAGAQSASRSSTRRPASARRCSTTWSPGATIACLGPLGRPFEAVRAAERSVDGRRRRRARAVRHAGRGASSSWARRRRCSTARARAPSCTTSICSNGSASTSCSPPKTAAAARPGASRRRSATRCRRSGDDAAIRLYVCGPTPMMRAVARLAARAPARLRRLARTGHGLRHGRLLQLRRARRATSRAPPRTSSGRASTAPSSTRAASSGRR